MSSDALTALARRALGYTLREGGVLPLQRGRDLVPALTREAGVIIGLYGDRMRLRGEAGIVLPRYDTIAEEIIDLAPRAALEDERFDPVTLEELDTLGIVVDVVTTATEVRDAETIDPTEAGLYLVSSSGKSSMVIPGMPGVRGGEQAMNIALAKLNIDPSEERITLFRFTVERHSEVLF